ncbi:rod shape-determining protein MreC [uncultured Veillonella sp.]|uniref:rod shape-determining protein MreC n=1 Tax=uncultured Veillonella sp. TaxID=159268 RepID=UPI0025837255|nr:rod shape-determining protein MreC [uncultured Veillonella sp.]
MFSSERKLTVFVVICCIILALLGYGWKHRTIIPYVTVPLEKVTTPFAYGASRVLDGVHTGIAVIDNAIAATKKIEALEADNAQLQQRSTDYDERVAENIRLRQLLNFRTTHPQFDMVPAMVMTRDIGTWTNTFTIDRGEAEGIAVNMAVVVPGGVVGFVSDVYEHSARVQTMLDPRTAIGVIVQRPESRVASVIKGNGNHPDEPRLVDVARDGDVLDGDALITSGYGGIYPKGLLVGHVVRIENDAEGFVKNAIVQPSANFRSIEEVFVILRSREGDPVKPALEPKLVPQTQRDQVQGVKGAMSQ